MTLFALILARTLGFVFRAPGISHPSVPPMVRAGFAVLFSVVILGIAHVHPREHGLFFVLALVIEFGIGSAIGFGAAILYDAAYAAGRTIDDYVGIRVMAPTATQYLSSGYGRLWSLAFTGGFFILGAYRIVIAGFAASFDTIAIGSAHALAWNSYVLALSSAVVKAAVLVAAPSIALAFAVQVALAALSRIVPRFATFSLSFPLSFAAALVGTILALPALYHMSGHPWLFVPHSIHER